MTISGSIDAIGVSGRYWIGGNEQGAYDLLVNSLLQAKSSIRIVAYSLGDRSGELDRIFGILREKINTGVRVQLIINRFWTITGYAQKQLKELEHRNFKLFNYEPQDERENLHAKIIIVDSTEILLGSANISKSGLFSNHEIVIKISGGEFASRVNSLVNVLAKNIFQDEKK
ncbi:MAG: phospholipase D family protein [Thaumarchaeota archaeon]|nr:phospholipase D family protein [Nitrososphaerota archaeon]